MPSASKPRIVSVKEKPVEERAPPNPATHRFVYSHKPQGAQK
ncbi:MAG: hypothetical protein V1708_00680 [Candidatus Micrarchaeota archaeon]